MKKMLYSAIVTTVFGAANSMALLDEEIHQVPDYSSTFVLLGLAMMAIMALRLCIRRAHA